MKLFILVTKNKDFLERRIKGHICEATQKREGGANESAVTQVCILRHNNYLNGLGRVNVHDKIL